MKELKRSISLKMGRWDPTVSGDQSDAIVNAAVEDRLGLCVVFVVFTDKALEPLTHLCAVARSLEFVDFERHDVLLFGHSARNRDWLHQVCGRSLGGARSVGSSERIDGMGDIAQILGGYGLELAHEFKDSIDQSLGVFYAKSR